ncbi:outer membrane biosynthesis protein TonB [Sphingomonas jejuensis]|uniref:Outer membrane biosynthesis protein TonB n=1 Tax=Sphingomonas jejuensis TaxID=904715 RepID=A0ABX0XMC2_9SPHN|nr:cell envelope biogenesis protein TolA [Sphingomonas jejuensis]NJC34511.1 outer membrane biosynthesis protein TonB [Sphingomonas jejuensis]
MDRSEKIGLGVATAAHVILFGILSVGFLATPNPRALESDPMDIAFVDEVAWKSAAPEIATEVPAESVAPELGPPTPAPAPEVAPTPTPPVEAAPEPTPAPPEPAPVAQPAPRATPRPPQRAQTRPRPTPPAATRQTPAERPRGSRLGDSFRQGLTREASKSTSQTPRAASVGSSQVASLSAAIQRQVQPCANRIPNPGPGANEIRSRIRLRMNENGTLDGRPTIVGQTGVNAENGRYAQRVAELAISAFIQCSPYELPAELYAGGWEDIILNYSLPG